MAAVERGPYLTRNRAKELAQDIAQMQAQMNELGQRLAQLERVQTAALRAQAGGLIEALRTYQRSAEERKPA